MSSKEGCKELVEMPQKRGEGKQNGKWEKELNNREAAK